MNRRTLLASLFAGLLACSVSVAQPPPPAPQQLNPNAIVRQWYRQYLGREPDQSGLITWTDSLRAGNPPDLVLASIVGSDEYYDRAGGAPDKFVGQLFRDWVGRDPNAREMDYWVNRTQVDSRRDAAFALMQKYPPTLRR
jgi:hypothetical protein